MDIELDMKNLLKISFVLVQSKVFATQTATPHAIEKPFFFSVLIASSSFA